jgi:hypothetical protein
MNLKMSIITISVLLLAGCGGGGSSTAPESTTSTTSTTYNAAASDGELLEYTLDETNLTYSYKVTSSALGINNDTHTGTLTSNADGTYTPSSAPDSKILVLPNKLVVGAAKLRINGADRYTLIAGIPTTTNVQFSDISGTYNYVSLQCLTTECNNSTGLPESAYGTFNIDNSGNWAECTRSNYTANNASCAGRDAGTLTSLGDGKFQIISGSTTMGTGMFYHSPTGQKVMVIDLNNYLGTYGRGMIFGVPQITTSLGGTKNGKYHWNTTQGNTGWVDVVDSAYTFDSGSTGTMTANTPWTGMIDAAGGYGMLADEGVYMWVPKSTSLDTYMVVGVKDE